MRRKNMKNIEIIKESTAILKVDRNKFESHPLFKNFFIYIKSSELLNHSLLNASCYTCIINVTLLST